MKFFTKIFLIGFILISNDIILNAQPITWQKNFGGPQSESSRCGIQTSDGDYIILYLKIGGNGGTYLLDLDPYGNERWNKKIDSVGTGVYIQQTIDGGFIVCGGKGEEGSLVKLDRQGNLIWNKTYYVNGQNTQFSKIKIIDSGNLVICGNVSFFPVKALVLKTDSIGNVIWQKILYYSGDSDASDILSNKDEFIYFTGAIKVNNYYKTLFAKMNSKGDFLWFTYHGSQGEGDSQAGNSIVSESNSELFISGPYQHFYSTQAHFTKIDSAGNVIFQNIISQANYANSMCKTSSGNYAIAGGYFPLTSDDIQLLVLNNNGVVILRKLFNSFGDEYDGSRSIVESVDKGFLISGSTTFEPNNIAGTSNLYIIKTDSNGNAPVSVKNISSEIPNSFKLFQNYPNPFNPTTQIRYELRTSNYVSVVVYDVLGNEVKTLVNQKQNAGSYEVEFDGSNLSSGIYFYKLVSNDFTAVKRMVLVK